MDSHVDHTHSEPRAGGCPRAAGIVDCAACQVRGISVCNALAPEELPELGRLARPCTFDPQQMITVEGQCASSVHNITGGVVRVYRMLDDGRRQILSFLFPGDILGAEIAKEACVSAEAVGSATACRFESDAFSRLISRKPRLMTTLHERTLGDLNAARDHAVSLGRRNAEERIGWFLVSLRDRAAGRGRGPSVIELPMSRQDIADHLGLTIETVSRTLTKLAREGTIALAPHQVRIVDRLRLERLAA